jgi:hypothetical protein
VESVLTYDTSRTHLTVSWTHIYILHLHRRCSCLLTITRWVSPVEQELLTLPKHLNSPPVFSGVRVARSLVFCVMFCRSLFVLLSFFLWPLCWLSFDWRLLITLLISSNFSYRLLAVRTNILSHYSHFVPVRNMWCNKANHEYFYICQYIEKENTNKKHYRFILSFEKI